MWAVEYYTRPDGSQPAREWIGEQDNSIRDSIRARIELLGKEGLILKGNGILVPIRRKRKKRDKFIPGFFELKHRGKKWRLGIYFDQQEDKFILLCGWRKHRQVQIGDVDKSRELLEEYLAKKEEQI